MRKVVIAKTSVVAASTAESADRVLAMIATTYSSKSKIFSNGNLKVYSFSEDGLPDMQVVIVNDHYACAEIGKEGFSENDYAKFKLTIKKLKNKE